MEESQCVAFERHRFRRYIKTCKNCGLTLEQHCWSLPRRVQAYIQGGGAGGGGGGGKGLVAHQGHFVATLTKQTIVWGLGDNWNQLGFDMVVAVTNFLDAFDLCRLGGCNKSWHLVVSSMNVTWERLLVSFPWECDAPELATKALCCPRGAFVGRVTREEEKLIALRFIKSQCVAGFASASSPDLLELDKFPVLLARARLLRIRMREHVHEVADAVQDANVALKEWILISEQYPNPEQIPNMAGGSLERHLKAAQNRVEAGPQAVARITQAQQEFETVPMEGVIMSSKMQAREIFESKPWVRLQTLKGHTLNSEQKISAFAVAELEEKKALIRERYQHQIRVVEEPQEALCQRIAKIEKGDFALLQLQQRSLSLVSEWKEHQKKVPAALFGGFITCLAIWWAMNLRFSGVALFAGLFLVAWPLSMVLIPHLADRESTSIQAAMTRREVELGIDIIKAELSRKASETDSQVGSLKLLEQAEIAELDGRLDFARAKIQEINATIEPLYREIELLQTQCRVPIEEATAIVARGVALCEKARENVAIPHVKPVMGWSERGGHFMAGLASLGFTYVAQRQQVNEWKRRVEERVQRVRNGTSVTEEIWVKSGL